MPLHVPPMDEDFQTEGTLSALDCGYLRTFDRMFTVVVNLQTTGGDSYEGASRAAQRVGRGHSRRRLVVCGHYRSRIIPAKEGGNPTSKR